jgi:hypothetical protein
MHFSTIFSKGEGEKVGNNRKVADEKSRTPPIAEFGTFSLPVIYRELFSIDGSGKNEVA